MLCCNGWQTWGGYERLRKSQISSLYRTLHIGDSPLGRDIGMSSETQTTGTILVVDDLPETICLVREIFENRGHTVLVATDGHQALQRAELTLPDLILLDLLMPGMDGYETCKALKRRKGIKDIPVIFMTVLTETLDKVKGFRLGAVDYVTKPIEAEELLARVGAHLTISRLQRRLQKMNADLERQVAKRTDELRTANAKLQTELAERIHAQEALRESEERLRLTMESADIGGWDWNVREDGWSASPVYYRMLGYEPRTETGPANRNEWLERVHPEDRADVAEKIRDVLAKNRNEHQYEARIRHADGTYRWHYVRGIGVKHDPEGRVLRMLGIRMDITERKQAEERRRQSQKMEAVGQLAGGVAHDFNNMMGSIMGYTDMAMTVADQDPRLHRYLMEIRKVICRSTDLTRQLLAFSRGQPITPRVLDINKIVNEMLNMLRQLIGKKIELISSSAPDLWAVKMDPSQLDQILVNLCVNGRDAIADRGKISIETKNIIFDETHCKTNAEYLPGHYVGLTVGDNGCGMDKKTLDKIFEPFFTTKGPDKGTGFGLATVYGIVKQNHGFIEVDSTPNIGTTFKIFLPRHQTKPRKKPQKKIRTAHSVPEIETILLAEDNASLLKGIGMVLEAMGYRVLSAPLPSDAIRMAREHPGEISLLITDVNMPEMNGCELANHLNSLHPKLKTLFISGYTDNIIPKKQFSDKHINFIEKPFSMDNLTAMVRKILKAD